MAAKRVVKTNGAVKGGVTVLPDTFDWEKEPYWKLDGDMVALIKREKLTHEVVQIPVADLDVPTYGHGMYQVRHQQSVETIAAYATVLRRKEKLPTGTIDADNQLVDLYHRAMAAKEVGVPYFILIRIQAVLDATDRALLATQRNNQHGLRMKTDDTLEWAVTGVEQKGWTIDEAVEKLGVDASSLRRRIAVKGTAKRAKAAKVEDEFADLPKTVQYGLATSGLHDAPFKAMVKLLASKNVPAGRAAEMIQEVASQTSDPKGLAVIKRIETVDLAPPTIGGGVAPRVLTFAEAVQRLLTSHGPLKSVLVDKTVLGALLKGSPTDPKFNKVHDVLKEMQPGFEKLVAHFGV